MEKNWTSRQRSWWADCGKNKVGGGGVWQPLSPSVIKSKSLSSCLSYRPPAKPPTTAISPGPCVPFNHVCALDYCGQASLHMLGVRGERQNERKRDWCQVWEKFKEARVEVLLHYQTALSCTDLMLHTAYLPHTCIAWHTKSPIYLFPILS